MNSPVGWTLPVAAVLATAIAIWAGANLTIAVPAAALAALAGGLLFVGAWLERPARKERRALSRGQPELFRLRSQIRSGPLGREELVTTLDRLERMGRTPDLAARSTDEMDVLRGLPPTEFLAYLRGRLDYLEGET